MTPTITEDGSAIVVELASVEGPEPRTLRLVHEPRESGRILWFDVGQWDEPADAVMTPAERLVVLDALAARHPIIAQHHDGFDVLLRAPAGERLVGTYQTEEDAGYVTLLEVGVTARVDVRQRFVRGLVKAALARDTATFLHPTKLPLGDADWQGIEAALVAADKSAFYMGPAWAFERSAE